MMAPVREITSLEAGAFGLTSDFGSVQPDSPEKRKKPKHLSRVTLTWDEDFLEAGKIEVDGFLKTPSGNRPAEPW